MVDKELIKQWIERLINDKTGGKHVAKADIIAPKRSAYLDILQFIDSLPEEPANEDLDEAAKHYLYDAVLYDDVYVGNPTEEDCIRCFKAGAEWQKQQIMKDVVSGEVRSGYVGNQIIVSSKDGSSKYVAFDASYADAFCVGDKVKIIIVKENML